MSDSQPQLTMGDEPKETGFYWALLWDEWQPVEVVREQNHHGEMVLMFKAIGVRDSFYVVTSTQWGQRIER